MEAEQGYHVGLLKQHITRPLFAGKLFCFVELSYSYPSRTVALANSRNLQTKTGLVKSQAWIFLSQKTKLSEYPIYVVMAVKKKQDSWRNRRRVKTLDPEVRSV